MKNLAVILRWAPALMFICCGGVFASGVESVVGDAINEDQFLSQTLAKSSCRRKLESKLGACPGSARSSGCDFATCNQLGSQWQCRSIGTFECADRTSPAHGDSEIDSESSNPTNPSVLNPRDDSEAGIDAVNDRQFVLSKCYVFPIKDPDAVQKIVTAMPSGYRADFGYTVRQRILILTSATTDANKIEIQRDLPVVVGFGDGGSRNPQSVVNRILSFISARSAFVCQ